MYHEQKQSMSLNNTHFQIKLKPHYLAVCLGVLMTPVSTGVFAAEESKTVDSNNYTKLSVITVYAEKEDKVPASIATISRENLDQMGAGEMADIVKYLPLVSAPSLASGAGSPWYGGGTSSYNIRGVEGNRVGLDVDGVELASVTGKPDSINNSSYSSGRDFIDPEMFSSVVVQSGTTDASKDGIGGRVTFKTKSPDEYLVDGKSVAGVAKAGYSSANDSWLTSVTGAVGNDVVQGLVAYSHRDGHETKSEGKLKENSNDWKSNAVLTRLNWNLTDHQSIGFTFDYYQKEADNFVSADLLSSLYPRGANQNITAERSRFTIDHTLKAPDFALFDVLKSSLSYQKTDADNQTTAYYNTGAGYRVFNNDYWEKNYLLKLDANKNSGNHNLTYGLSANKIESDHPWVQQNPNGTVTTQNRMVKSDTKKYAAYVQDKILFDLNGHELQVMPGIRYEHYTYTPKNTNSVITTSTTYQDEVTKKSYNTFSPSLTFGYDVNKDVYAYAKYSRGNRIPTAAEMAGTYDPGRGYAIIGNSSIKKETSDAFEVGIKTTPVQGVRFDITGFYTAYKDFIDYKTVTDDPLLYQIDNIANVNIWGGELSTHIDLGQFIHQADGFSLALVAGAINGTGKDKSGDKSGVNSIQPEKASLTFAYDDPNKVYGFGLTATAVGAKTASSDVSSSNSSTNYLPVSGYTLYDLSAYWNVHKNVKLNVALNNMFDKKYWLYSTVATVTDADLIDRSTMPGRNVVASVQFKY